jgi:acyl transferase domain-containing protein
VTGECDLAFVGGVNVMLTPDVSITFSRAAMLAPDGCCKAFDQAANGYVRGEGAAVVVLKPLSRALLDRDRIHAVLCATAINQDGHTSTITVPSRDAQVAMLRDACGVANVDPLEVGYVEAHGTGTPIGDPIEAHAIGSVFGESRPAERPCLIGSIKTNIGHLEPAAGVVGLIKAALCVREGEIPPSLNYKNPNPHIDFRKLGIKVQSELTPWPDMPGSRIAAVNSFGFGGTNACAIVKEPPVRLESLPPTRAVANWWPTMLPVSAATKKTLATLCGRFASRLSRRGDGREPG